MPHHVGVFGNDVAPHYNLFAILLDGVVKASDVFGVNMVGTLEADEVGGAASAELLGFVAVDDEPMAVG